MDKQEQLSIASEIIRQLGGNHFIAMTGAKGFIYGTDESGNVRISFRIGRNSARINGIRITLNGDDLYDTEYLWMTVKEIKTRSKSEGIYNDGLRQDFENNTGLRTSL